MEKKVVCNEYSQITSKSIRTINSAFQRWHSGLQQVAHQLMRLRRIRPKGLSEIENRFQFSTFRYVKYFGTSAFWYFRTFEFMPCGISFVQLFNLMIFHIFLVARYNMLLYMEIFIALNKIRRPHWICQSSSHGILQ